MSSSHSFDSSCSRRTFVTTCAWLCGSSWLSGWGCVSPMPPSSQTLPFTYTIPAENNAFFEEIQRILIVRTQNRVYALSSRCTHEDCNVVLETKNNVLDCPCHGAKFALDGAMLEAPAERDLDRYALRLLDTQRVVVDVTKRFQKGQTGYNEAFVNITGG